MIRIEPLTIANWERVLSLRVEEEQQKFIPDNLFSIAQAKFEPQSEVLGIYKDQRLVGMMIVAYWAGVYWISRIMIDQYEQGNGYGTRAIELAKKYIFDKRDVKAIRTSIARENAVAEYVFYQNGFRRLGQVDEREFTMEVEYKSQAEG
ncbi:MAG: GNAT family N-acetyltransferase [Bacteroidetes bacterium]|jgi:diamine N-acetyltransferase|nr:GNAT family N-acetyltransferase [Bacteroidota bacterium]